MHSGNLSDGTKLSHQFEAKEATANWYTFKGETKCTFIFWTEQTSKYAPGFWVTRSDFSNYELQWSEWYTDNVAAGF